MVRILEELLSSPSGTLALVAGAFVVGACFFFVFVYLPELARPNPEQVRSEK